MYICIDNASRTGAIANMAMKEFLAASKQGDSYVVRVIKHKTIETSGPSCLVLRQKILNEAQRYFNILRKVFVDMKIKKTYPFFTSFHGKRMSSSMVTGQLNSFWQRAVGKGERFIATKTRKTSVTTAHTKKSLK